MKMAGLLRALGTEVRRSGESPCSTTTESMGDRQVSETLLTAQLLGAWDSGDRQRTAGRNSPNSTTAESMGDRRRTAGRKSPDSTTAGSVVKDRSGVLPIIVVPVPGTKCLHRPWPVGHGLPSQVCHTCRETQVTQDGLH